MKEPTPTEQALKSEIESLKAKIEENEQALHEAYQQMNEFLSIVSHELRTPLTSINGNIQLAKRRLNHLIIKDGMSEEILDTLDVILELMSRAENQVHVQNRLMNNLLDASRIQANKIELHKQDCDLLSIIRTTIEEQRSINPLRTISLVPPPMEHISIIADCNRIEKVLNHYLSNALKYSETEQPVLVSVEITKPMVYVYVKDSGSGIPANITPYIWQRFYRNLKIKAPNATGTGLGVGLYISKTFIEQHQGMVGVESEPGKGSTFWFSLPLKETDA